MRVVLNQKINAHNSAVAASKSHGKPIDDMSPAEMLEYVEKHAPTHRNVAEHMVYAIDIQNITRAASEIIGETKYGFSMTEMSQRYRSVRDFAWDHPYNEIAATGYDQLMSEFKWQKQDARYVLPETAATEMLITANRVAWFDIARRLYFVDKYDMRELADGIVDILSQDIQSDLSLLKPKVVTVGGFPLEPMVQVDDCCGSPMVTTIDQISVSAYQQLKRHRTAPITQRGPMTGEWYEEGLPRKGRVLYRSLMEQGSGITKNGDMRWFKWQIPLNELPNFFSLRCSTHAQREIRDWATQLRKDVY